MLSSSYKLNHSRLSQRPKRKERTTKRTKACSSKPKRTCDSIDATTKLKNEFKNKENRSTTNSANSTATADKTILSLLTKGRISQKVGIYGKGKASQTIKRRKVLATVQPSSDATPVQYQRPVWDNLDQATPTTSKGSNPSLTARAPHPLVVASLNRHLSSKPHHSVKDSGRKIISLNSSPENNPRSGMDISSGSVSGSSPSSVDGCHSMDTMDNSSNDSVIIDISEKIIAGLKPNDSFPSSSDYLGSVCRELRKVMRQSDSETYKELEQCFLSPCANDGCPNTMLETIDPSTITDNIIEGVTLANDHDMPPLITDTSTDYCMETTACNIMTSSPIHGNSYWRPIDNVTYPPANLVPRHTTTLTHPPLHHHCEVNTTFMSTRPPLCPSSLSNTVLLSSCAVDLPSPTEHKNALVEGDLLDNLVNDDDCRDDRPRMYPHKLY